MPRAALTAEELGAFRERAVAAATRLFADQGYRGMTLRSLAKELGVSPMTPYRYFENKEELFAMVRIEAFRRFADAQRDTVKGIEDPQEALRVLGRAYVSFALDEPRMRRTVEERLGFKRAAGPDGDDHGHQRLLKHSSKAGAEHRYHGGHHYELPLDHGVPEQECWEAYSQKGRGFEPKREEHGHTS